MAARNLSLFLFCLLVLFSACAIQNSHRVRKRALFGPHPTIRQCSRCGPFNRGKCFGPDNCCLPNRTCFSGSIASQECENERFFIPPCKDPGHPCRGACRHSGLCCNDVICIPEPSCP